MKKFVVLIALLAGASLQAQFTLDREPIGPSSRKTGLVITEIMYNPLPAPGVTDTNRTLEFIELYNTKPWPEPIGGYTITGDVTYVFPAETEIGAGQYLVLARVPALLESTYAITGVLGPWDGATTNRLSTERGLVQLLNRQRAVLLSIDYRDSPPWPEGADGTGHSLSLVRPSYGEADERAWAQSDTKGGSPGKAEPVTLDPLAPVVINEWQNHSDPVDWIELYNHSNALLDLSGAFLSDAASSNFFRIPNGTFIQPNGYVSYDQNQLGFELFAGGETVFLWNSNRTRLLDVVDFRGQSNNVSSGRSPDGGPFKYSMATRTRGGPNSAPMRYAVVISEIMYNPISAINDDEYIEIHNRSNLSVDLSNWAFEVGIDYIFPTNDITKNMPAGAYWVLAKNPELLMAIYPNLTTNNTFGPYDGTLANGGERVLLTAADYDIVNNGMGMVLERLPVPVCDVTYRDGGKWGQWSDGLGSSLELIDPEGDVNHPSNWADSNDTAESPWTSVEMTVPLGQSLGPVINDNLILMMQGDGECLIDEVEVRVNGGQNLVMNGGFESGLSGWTLQGSHDFSTIENEGFDGTKSLHVRAASRGDNQSNRILSPPFASPIPAQAGLVTLRAKMKWLRGLPELVMRLHGSATEGYGRMALPRHLGTPGMPNSNRIANAGPAVHNVLHSPLLPAASQPVVVTARAADPQGILSIDLRYRLDPSTDYVDLPMTDNGTGGDEIMNDGIYSATIPGQPTGAIVDFYVEAHDGLDGVGTFPAQVFPSPGFTRVWPSDAVRHECVVRWGEVQMPGDFATYHLWVSSVNSNRWHHRDAMNNTDMDGTFVYNNTRVVYNAQPNFSGSPWHRTNSITGPAGPNRVDYEMNFPDDEPMLGATDFVLNNPGNPDVLTISDLSALAEQTVYRIFEGLDMPHNHRRYFHFFVNGSQRSTAYERSGNFIFEDSQQPNGDMVAEWFPGDPGGQLFKVEDWFEFSPNGFDITAYDDADLERRMIEVEGEPTFVPGPYRFKFRKRSIGVGSSANDYTPIYGLINAVSPPENPNSATIDPDLLSTAVDWEAWMRHFAVQRAIGNWDSFGWERGKNDYLYQTTNGFVHMPWDIDYNLGLGKPADAPLFDSNDSRVRAMFNTPAIARAYWRAFHDIVEGPFKNEVLDPFIDQRAGALLANNVNIDTTAVANIKTYIHDRRLFLQNQLATVDAPFAIDGSLTYSTAENLVIITGTAPVDIKYLAVNGQIYPVTWTSVTQFMLRVVLNAGVNNILLEGMNRLGVRVPGVTQTLAVEYTGPVVDPNGALVFSEIMTTPLSAGGQFIEVQNLSAFNFDLSGWRVDGINLNFPVGAIITNHQTVLLVQDRATFLAQYGSLPVFAVFGGNLASQGQAIVLVKTGAPEPRIVDAVRYEGTAPWVEPMPGESLQLIDANQDNSRSANWTADPVALATPGAPNSVAHALPAFDTVWLNEVQTENLAGPSDNQGEKEPWLELFNPGTAPVSLNGYFLARSYEANLTEWAFPLGVTIPAGQSKLIWGDGELGETTGADIHTGFRFDYGGKLALVRMVEGQPQITDHLTWLPLGANISYGDYPDGQPVFRSTLYQSTPGATNKVQALPLFINEWMAKNKTIRSDPADGGFEDWFEIYNGGFQTIDLGGYYLTDNHANPTKYQVPNNGDYTVPPGGFLLVWADDEDQQNSGNRADLHVEFELGGSGGVIALYAPDGLTEINSISYLEQTDDISEGRFSDGSSAIYVMGKPTPLSRNTFAGWNTAPYFPPIPPVTILQGTRLTWTTRASDAESPPQIITYSYTPAREGAGINQGGLFRWIVPANQPPGAYEFVAIATDNGVPPRTGMASFVANITGLGAATIDTPPPIIEGIATPDGRVVVTFQSSPGALYRVSYTDQLDNAGLPTWTLLLKEFAAANNTASITDFLSGPHRFYRVELVE